MPSYTLEDAIAYYREKLNALESPHTTLASPEDFLEVLLARDAVEVFRLQQTTIPSDLELELITQDQRLKNRAAAIAKLPDLTQWRESLVYQTKEWWWSIETDTSVHFCDRLDWLWRIGTIIFVVLSLSFAGNIAPRFWAGGPSALGTFSIVGPSLLNLLLGKEALEQASRSQASLEHILRGLKLPRILWQEIICGLAFFLFLGMAHINSSLPDIAKNYYCQGLVVMKESSQDEYKIANNKDGDCYHSHPIKNIISWLMQFSHSSESFSAESNLKVAIALNPNYAKAHFQLGWLYELRQDLDQAREHYKAAMQNDSALALTRLASLYLRDDSEKSTASANIAATILNREMDEIIDTPKVDQKTKRSLHIALGWARLKQKRYTEASNELKRADELHKEITKRREQHDPTSQPETTVLYCVNADLLDQQVKQKKADNKKDPDKEKEAKDLWIQCRNLTNPKDPDEDFWLGKAYKRLRL